ncbi:hypothetical protein [Haloferax sulfurifontis]|uniref:Uncharacterized protein n=1 Tax=Haloferax sulfurifontis TaxID=255616 RepID=A0A830E415_9EURY|nr:hypothetical protein [Haloferax sulfurifontis]GGC52302.1 hypothetical protein GCM10007209_12460 [Haloferax sulfurifontis]
MANLRVNVRNVDDDTLFTHKTIRVGSKTIDTPSKAIPIRKLTSKDPIATTARGVNEIYFEVSAEDLRKAQETYSSPLKKKIKTARNKTKTGEINVIIPKVTSVKPLSDTDLQYLSDFLQSTSDFVVIPLMTDLLEKIKEDNRGTSSKYFDTYKQNVKKFIEISLQLNEKPLMGTLPPLPWKFTNKIIDIYINNNIRAYCFDFNGKMVTAETQLSDMVTPLMRRIAMEKMQEDVFLYSLNANRGRKKRTLDLKPASDFLTFGFGFDILGDKHIGGNLPPHLFDKTGPDTFQVFEPEKYTYDKFLYDDLRANLPSSTELDISRIVNRPQDSSRLSILLNSEQQSLETERLKPAIDEYRVVDYIKQKRGVLGENLDNMVKEKSRFEGNKNQTSLDDLDYLFD